MLAIPWDERIAPAHIPAPMSRAEALGYLYVAEAFRLGCWAIARKVHGLGIRAENGAAFVVGLGAGTRDSWLRLVGALRETPAADHAEVVKSAHDLFGRWEEWLRSPHARMWQLRSSSGVYEGP